MTCELGDTRSTCGICEFTWETLIFHDFSIAPKMRFDFLNKHTLGFNQPEKEVTMEAATDGDETDSRVSY